MPPVRNLGAKVQQFRPFFSFAGRMNRQQYWVTSVLINFAFLAAALTAGAFAVVGLFVIIPVAIVGVWIGLAAATRRLHDRNRSAWWLLAMYGPVMLFAFLGGVVATSDPQTGSALSGVSTLFSIWIFVDLGCLKGTIGPNRFGDDPLRPSPAEVFA